jgi:hypothetical protein
MTDTTALISQANIIVQACTGTNCNVSQETRRAITEKLSILAQEQSDTTLFLLGIPKSSVIGRNIYESYLNLGAAVSSVYNFQCGNNVTNSYTCVPNSNNVKLAQDSLQTLISQPAQNEIHHITILSILMSIAIIALILFFVFLIIGMIETLIYTPGYIYRSLHHQSQQPTIQSQQPTIQSQQPIIQSQQPIIQSQQPTIQLQQPIIQSQQPIIQSQIIQSQQQPTIQLQEPIIKSQQPEKIPVPVSPFETQESIYK